MTKLSEELIEIASISLNLLFIVCVCTGPIVNVLASGDHFLGYGTSTKKHFLPPAFRPTDKVSTTPPRN